MALRALSLCAGIGGIDLGLRGVARTVCYVEREAFAAAILRARMQDGSLDDAPIWSDLGTFDARAWRGAVDLVVAGFPCQPFSSASRGRRVARDLWPECLRIALECEASVVFAENVQRKPIRIAANDLVARGFRAVAAPMSSAQLGAPHDRVRWWLLAYADGDGERVLAEHGEVAELRAHANDPDWNDPEPALVGVDDGLSSRLDRLRALGNAVVPQVAARAFAELAGRLTR